MVARSQPAPHRDPSRVHHNEGGPAGGSEHGLLSGEDAGGCRESITSPHTLRPQDVSLPEVPASGAGTTLGEQEGSLVQDEFMAFKVVVAFQIIAWGFGGDSHTRFRLYTRRARSSCMSRTRSWRSRTSSAKSAPYFSSSSASSAGVTASVSASICWRCSVSA